MLESGALSDKNFPSFAAKVVPFLHVTTHIEGHPHDSLLSEKGGTGFPTLMFLDAEGRRLMKHGGARTPQGFEDSLLEVQAFQALERRAEEGDAQAATELFLRQLKLEWFDIEEARKRAGALTEVSSKQKAEIAQLLVNTEVRSLASAAGKDEAKIRDAGKRFHEMWQAKSLPEGDALLYAYWSMMADFAEAERDKKLFKKIVDEFKDTIPGDSRYRGAWKGLKARLDHFPKK